MRNAKQEKEELEGLDEKKLQQGGHQENYLLLMNITTYPI